jgi:hypothetical protein
VNDADYAAAKELLEPIVDRWLETLGLRWWDITLEFCRAGIPTRDTHDGMPITIYAQVSTRWHYQTAIISLNVPALVELPDRKIEAIIVHECMHIFLNELQHTTDDWSSHEEHTASMLAKAVLWARDLGIQEAQAQVQTETDIREVES